MATRSSGRKAASHQAILYFWIIIVLGLIGVVGYFGFIDIGGSQAPASAGVG